MLKAVEARLGDKLDPVYESVDVPYAFYTVLKGNEVIGLVHGVNQKGTYGGMQVILATDLAGKIVDFYLPKDILSRGLQVQGQGLHAAVPGAHAG